MSARIGTVALGGPRPCIVAAGGEHEVGALAVADDADVVELRADLFDAPSVAGTLDAIARLRAGGRPILFTARAGAEGGRPMDEALRLALYEAALPQVEAIDVEIASTSFVARLVPTATAAGCTVVLSAHDFAATPPAGALRALVEHGFVAGAQVAKLATHTATLADLGTLLDVTRETAGRPVATLGMGPLGPLSRLVLAAAGSVLTYAAVGTPTAPGQLPLTELAALVRRFFPR